MKLLIVDDDYRLRTVLYREFCEDRYNVEQAECGEEALDLMTKKDFDVMLLDLNLPDIKGKSVLRRVKKMDVSTEIVVLTGYGSIESAVEMIKMGAYDYVTKPYEFKKLKTVIEKAGERKELLQENRHLRTQLQMTSIHQKIVTKNKAFLEILKDARRFARCEFPVMLNGETGVGKELFAEEIHMASSRSNGPFIPVNCGAIPESMIESELFGHEKGAFTSAITKKLGLMEIAHRGTLFLDEIGDFPNDFQQKLLRVLESKRFFRVGGIKQVEVDVRIISATNKDLQSEMERGKFRKDLYYRLSTLTLKIPPLRHRLEDLPNLIESIIDRMNDSKIKFKTFSGSALKVLEKYEWPGNVRELQNIIHRTVLLSNNKEIIQPEDLPFELTSGTNIKNRSLQDVEKNYILRVLKEEGGKKTNAAKVLGIDPKTLYRKLQYMGEANT